MTDKLYALKHKTEQAYWDDLESIWREYPVLMPVNMASYWSAKLGGTIVPFFPRLELSVVYMALAKEIRERMIRDGVDPELVEIKDGDVGYLLMREVEVAIQAETKEHKSQPRLTVDAEEHGDITTESCDTCVVNMVRMTQAEFDALYDYSCSIPTRLSVGKQWKRRKNYHDEKQGWLLATVLPGDKENMVTINWTTIEIEDE
jgi:hypothetical protein